MTWNSLSPVQKKLRKIVSEAYGKEYEPKKNIGCEGPLKNQTSRAISISNWWDFSTFYFKFTLINT